MEFIEITIINAGILSFQYLTLMTLSILCNVHLQAKSPNAPGGFQGFNGRRENAIGKGLAEMAFF